LIVKRFVFRFNMSFNLMKMKMMKIVEKERVLFIFSG